MGKRGIKKSRRRGEDRERAGVSSGTMKQVLPLACSLALFAVTLVAAPGTAHARKGIPLIYNTGQETFASGPLPAPYDQVPQLAGFQAGYLCDIKGVLWSYFSVSNCKPVAFKDDSYTDEAEIVEAIKAKYPESSMQRGIWDRFGWMLLLGAAVVGALIALKSFFLDKDDDADSGDNTESRKAA